MLGKALPMELSTLACKAEEVDRWDEANRVVWLTLDCKRRGRLYISATSTLTLRQTKMQSQFSSMKSLTSVSDCITNFEVVGSFSLYLNLNT